VSKGFYNWKDFSTENVEYIKKVIHFPQEVLLAQAMDVTWCEAWGKEPEDTTEYIKSIKEKLAKAPILLPVFSHRYMPVTGEENPPVLSIHGTDIIYYGETLSDYLYVEFGEKKQTDIAFEQIPPVRFWSEIM